MTVEILNTGSELLLGNVVNTHLAWLGQQLFPLGLRVSRQTTVPDGDAIRTVLEEAFPRCEILIVTGGLGPTTDDITREITAELLKRPLVEDPAIFEEIARRLEKRRITLRERMRRQAMVPEGAVVLPNANGTAPGLYLSASELDGTKTPHLFLFPGPPRELQPMFIDHALPILESIVSDRGDTICRVYRVVGMGESTVEEILGLALSERGDLEVGYCARPNEVDFRLIGPAALIAEVEPLVLSTLGDHVVAFDNESLEKRIVEELRKSKRTLATAESCTGGLVAHRITNVPGSSEIFLEGYVTYSNEAKSRSVNVPAELIETLGAVSEPVACAMAEGARLTTGAEFGIGITGIAGPGGGTETKPVGTVFIALAQEGEQTLCRREYFPTDRETFKQLASQTALDMLRRRLNWLDR